MKDRLGHGSDKRGAHQAGVAAVGRLPFDVRAPRESIADTLDANFEYGQAVGNETVPISSLSWGSSASAEDQDRIAQLKGAISGPNGYIERPIVDDAGNVVEGQHRVASLHALGVTQVPIYRVRDLARTLPVEKMRAAIDQVGGIGTDQRHQIIDHVLHLIAEEGSPKAVREGYSFPGAYRAHFEAALKAAGG